VQLPRPPWRKGRETAKGDAAWRSSGVGPVRDGDDHGFADAVDRLTRALHAGRFEVPADRKPG
jgi:hypothetical protein